MKIGVTMFCTASTIGIVKLAQEAEALGFESLFVPEHPAIPVKRETPWPGGGELPEFYKHTVDPFVALMAAAASTRKLRVGTAICLLPQRDPIVTAKQVATLDLISGGRFEFGVGAGWLTEEMNLFGVDVAHRWGQTKDHVLAMKALWSGDTSEYHGKYVDFPALWCHPKPVQKPHPPVLIAGEGEHVARRVAAYGDGWIPRGRRFTPQDVEAGRKRIEAAMKSAGRKPSGFTVSLFAPPPERALLQQFGSAGCDRAILMMPSEDEAKSVSLLRKWAAELL